MRQKNILQAALCLMLLGGGTAAEDAPPAATPAPAVAPAPAPPPPITATLNDDSKIEIDADGSVFVITDAGKREQAPDGTLTLRDGTPFRVKDGKRVEEKD